jgi:hypothetical protein
VVKKFEGDRLLGGSNVDGRKLLKYILKKQGRRLWSGFIWLKNRDEWWVLVNIVISLHIT